jgi:hypothetical protein
MNLQYIFDSNGKTTVVFIPIEVWQSLKTKYTDLVENAGELAPWQEQIIDERLSDYYNNPKDVADFDKTIADIEKNL